TLHALREPGGVPLHLHRHDGDHGGGGREGHAGRPHRGRGALHGVAGGAPGRHLLAVADAALRNLAGGRAVLHARGDRAGPARARPGRPAPLEPVVTLEAHDLTVRFGGVPPLAGVSFTGAAGTVTSLIGPNGAGKTTAFNVITGFQRPTQGTVRHDGQPITGWRAPPSPARGGRRPLQKTSVFPGLTVRENVLTGLHLQGRVGVAAALLARGRVRAEEHRLEAEADRVIDFVGLGARRAEAASGLSY